MARPTPIAAGRMLRRWKSFTVLSIWFATADYSTDRPGPRRETAVTRRLCSRTVLVAGWRDCQSPNCTDHVQTAVVRQFTRGETADILFRPTGVYNSANVEYEILQAAYRLFRKDESAHVSIPLFEYAQNDVHVETWLERIVLVVSEHVICMDLGWWHTKV